MKTIKILSPSEVAQMNQDQLEMLNMVPVQHMQQHGLTSSDSGETHPQSSLPDSSSGAMDH